MVEGKAMSTQPSSNVTPGEQPLRVRRGRVSSVDLFEVKEHELQILEQGTPADLYLNFAIFLISTAISTITALCTATFENTIVQNVFIFVSVIGVLGGIFLLILWKRTRASVRIVIRDIRCRIPPDIAIPDADDPPAPTTGASTAPSGSAS